MITKDYYRILHLQPGAGEDDIKMAYRQLAKQYHPDVNKAPDAHEKFCEISEAYDYLINHWSHQQVNVPGRANYEQTNSEYQQTAAYEQFIREARERAKRQARMRYEKFKKQHEAFQESGLNDLGLVFTIIIRIFSVVLFMFLFFTPLVLTFILHWSWIFSTFFMWPFALGLGWYYYDNRRNYFKPGEFYYSLDRIRHIFKDRYEAKEKCYYCKHRMADSRPYKVELLKLKDIKLSSEGFRQHRVNYISKNYFVSVPRSRKALIVHTTGMVIRVLTIISCLIFLDLTSVVWKIIAGITVGAVLSRLLFLLFRTKSNVSYLFSAGLMIRIALWIVAVTMVSRFHFDPFDIRTTDSIYFVVVVLLIFDSFAMQIINLLLGKSSSVPLFRQYPEMTGKLREGYIIYNEVPAISFLYPILKWIFG